MSVKVSVIIPMYNVESFIGETISSFDQQDLEEVEYILVNDGSTDKTLDVVKSLTAEDKRFTIIDKVNEGVSIARNKGLEVAKGEFITFLDSDDKLADDSLNLMYNLAQEYEADLVLGAILRFNSTKEWIIDTHIKYNVYSNDVKDIYNNAELFYSMGPCAKLYKRELLAEAAFPKDIHYGEDQVISYYTYINAQKIKVTDEIVYLYRQREEGQLSLTQSTLERAPEFLDGVFAISRLTKSITDQNTSYSFEEKEYIYARYLERLFAHDFYPLLKNVIRHQDVQLEYLQKINMWIASQSDFVINTTASIRYFLFTDFKNYYSYLSKESREEYLSILNTIYDKLTELTVKTIRNNWKQNFAYYPELRDGNKQVKGQLLRQSYKFRWKRQPIVKKVIRAIRQNKRKLKVLGFKLVYSLSKTFMPKDQTKVFFGNSHKPKLTGNLQVVHEAIDPIKFKKIVYTGKERKFNAEMKKYYHLATASVIFVDDYYYPLYGKKIRKGTEFVQLWHAAGAFKTFSFSALDKGDANLREFEERAHQSYTKILCSSDIVGQYYQEAFNAKADKLLKVGTPRTDELFDIEKNLSIVEKFSGNYTDYQDKKIILYAPTFRGNPIQRRHFQMPFDWRWFEMLPEDYIIFVKLHPVVKSYSKIPDDYRDRFVFVNDEDINELMRYCDLLITDYSSLIFEYSLLNRPIVFFPYDLANYWDERGFYEPYENYAFGPIAYNTEELMLKILNSGKSDTLENEAFKQKFMAYCDGDSTSKLLAALKLR